MNVGFLCTITFRFVQSLSHMLIVSIIFVYLWLLFLVFKPETPICMFMGTAAWKNIDIASFNSVFSSLEGLIRRISCDQMLIKMPSKFSANIIGNLRMRINGYNHRYSDTLEELTDHFRVTSTNKDQLNTVISIASKQILQSVLSELIQHAKLFAFFES